MLLTFLRVTSFLSINISLEHGLHKGHALIAPKLLLGLLGLSKLTCCCRMGLAIAVIEKIVHGVVGLVRAIVHLAFAMLV
jgi:hypothetical protein